MALAFNVISLLFCIKILAVSSWKASCPPWWEHPAQTLHLPHPTDCGQFLTCVPGGAVPQRCPAGLHWNDRRKVCDWPWIAGCDVRPVGCSFGQLLPHVDCDKYYLCLDNSRKVVLYCPESLHFNADSKKCVHPWFAGCGGWTPPSPTTLPPITALPFKTTLEPTTSIWQGTDPAATPDETSKFPSTNEVPTSSVTVNPA
uniref:Putative peritrophin-1 n=1 Tax=Culex tarsalis TaxID=7177 RepID=A0A1Q3FS54_CULTA